MLALYLAEQNALKRRELIGISGPAAVHVGGQEPGAKVENMQLELFQARQDVKRRPTLLSSDTDRSSHVDNGANNVETGEEVFRRRTTILQAKEGSSRPSIWGFDERTLQQFPALRKRNFACIQEHQATAYHFDLRLQLDGGTFSWAIPKGFLDLQPGAWQYAIETTIHPISYSTHEGSDGRVHKNGTRCGTLLWDICEYSIGALPDANYDPDSPGEDEDESGRFEEDKLRHALYGRLRANQKSRYVKLILKNGEKFTHHSFTLFMTEATYDSRGQAKKQWMIKLGPGVHEAHTYPENADKSVKSGRDIAQVTSGQVISWRPKLEEQIGTVGEENLGVLLEEQPP